MRDGRFVRGEVFPDPEQAVVRFAAGRQPERLCRARTAGSSAAQLGQRRVALLVHRDRRFDPGDLQQPPHLVVVRAEDQPALALVAAAVEPLPGAHDQGDPGRVDELALGEVEHDRGAGIRERLVELPLELRRRVHVQLAADGEGANAVLELLALHLEGNRAHRPILPQASAAIRRVGESMQVDGLCPDGEGSRGIQKPDDYARFREEPLLGGKDGVQLKHFGDPRQAQGAADGAAREIRERRRHPPRPCRPGGGDRHGRARARRPEDRRHRGLHERRRPRLPGASPGRSASRRSPTPTG